MEESSSEFTISTKPVAQPGSSQLYQMNATKQEQIKKPYSRKKWSHHGILMSEKNQTWLQSWWYATIHGIVPVSMVNDHLLSQGSCVVLQRRNVHG